MVAFFFALGMAFSTNNPGYLRQFRQWNSEDIERTYKSIFTDKRAKLNWAVSWFMLGMFFLVIMILWILWM